MLAYPYRNYYDNPWREVNRLHRSMGNLYNQLQAQSQGSSEWNPSCDVRESNDSITVHADLPGIKRDDIHLNVDNGVLTISGQRAQKRSVGDTDTEGCHVSERQWGSFSRSIRLPPGIDTSAIEACHEDGVLEVTIPKPQSQLPSSSRIQIRDRAHNESSAASASQSSDTNK
jgi:HSP20 family protein